MAGTKNKLTHLNDHLFAQLERLADEKLTAADVDKEVKRGRAIVALADQVVKNASLQVQVAKMVSEKGNLRPLIPAAAGLPDAPRPQLVEATKK